jgi:hypothetical protein
MNIGCLQVAAIPYIDDFANYYLPVSKKWAMWWSCQYNQNCYEHLMPYRISGGHRANAGNTTNINRLRCAYIENSY